MHSFDLKLQRARTHLKIFETDAHAWLTAKPYSIVDEPDPNPITDPIIHERAVSRRFRVIQADPVPSDFSLVIGDCVHNIRCALDHLALSLARAFTPSMTPEQIQRSEFPIFANRPMHQREETDKIGCIAPGARTIMKALQPYHRGSNYHTDPLWQVYELDRIDKHRTLTVCASFPFFPDDKLGEYEGAIGFITPPINVERIPLLEPLPQDLKSDAVLLRYTAIAIDPSCEVKMQPSIAPQITFADGPVASSQPVIPTLQRLCDFVGNVVIPQLAKFL